MRNLLWLILMIFIFSCNNYENNKNEIRNSDSLDNYNLLVSSTQMNIFNFIYNRKFENDKESKFYYPCEIGLVFKIENKYKDSLLLYKIDSLQGSKKYDVFITCNFNNEVINLYTHHRDFNFYSLFGKQNTLQANLIDLPIFDSIYSTNEFINFIKEFRKSAIFHIYFKEPSGTISSFKVNSSYMEYYFYIDESLLELSSIGYPDSINIIDKSVIGPYIGWN